MFFFFFHLFITQLPWITKENFSSSRLENHHPPIGHKDRCRSPCPLFLCPWESPFLSGPSKDKTPSTHSGTTTRQQENHTSSRTGMARSKSDKVLRGFERPKANAMGGSRRRRMNPTTPRRPLACRQGPLRLTTKRSPALTVRSYLRLITPKAIDSK